MKNKYLKTIWFFLKNYKVYVFWVFIFSVSYAVFEGLSIAILFPIIKAVIETDAAPGSGGGVAKILNVLIKIIPVNDIFIAACMFMILAILFKNIFRYLYLVFSSYGGYKVWEDVQKKLFAKYINADYRYFLDHKQGEIFYRIYSAPGSVGGILQLIPQFFTEILKIFIIGVLLFSMSFPVTCGVVIIGGIFYVFTKGISIKISYFLGQGRIEACEEQSIIINEMISGIKQIKIFLGENRWTSNFYKEVDKYFKLSKKDTLWINMPASALEIFALTVLSVFLIFVKRFYPQGLVSNLPIFGVFAYAFQRVMPSLSLITTLKMQLMGGLPVFEILHNAINEKTVRLKDGAKSMNLFNDKIEFRNVSFSYPDRPEVLRNISLSFEKNRCIAIAGASGSGKTTMINLLIRLFDPTKGAILVDGADLRDYRKNTWLNKIGLVSQDAFIFHASVYDNIVFGLNGYSKQDVIDAAKTANAHDFISKLPQGYETIVGERGMKLSGGEQQRISIARAMLRKPQILIFDEATSALDNISQSLIQNAIQRIVKDHTVILIAHRLSTIVNADKIVVLDDGIIKETGKHSELIAKNGFYWKLYNNKEEPVLSG